MRLNFISDRVMPGRYAQCARCQGSVYASTNYCHGCGKVICEDCCRDGDHIGANGRHEVQAEVADA